MNIKKIGIFCFWAITTASVLYAQPSPEQLRQTIRDYVSNRQKLQGAFAIVDERTGGLRRLELVRVHDRVGKAGDYYYSCTDMTDVKTGELLDLDFDVEDKAGQLSVANIRIHKDDGIPRYTYNERDQRVPLPVAELKPTVEGSPIKGKVSFMETEEGIKINAVVENAPAGKHGFHIHEKGIARTRATARAGILIRTRSLTVILKNRDFNVRMPGILAILRSVPTGKENSKRLSRV